MREALQNFSAGQAKPIEQEKQENRCVGYALSDRPLRSGGWQHAREDDCEQEQPNEGIDPGKDAQVWHTRAVRDAPTAV